MSMPYAVNAKIFSVKYRATIKEREDVNSAIDGRMKSANIMFMHEYAGLCRVIQNYVGLYRVT